MCLRTRAHKGAKNIVGDFINIRHRALLPFNFSVSQEFEPRNRILYFTRFSERNI